MPDVLRGARLFTDPTAGALDITVSDGVIVDIAAAGSATTGNVIDLDGLELMPGCIDSHVHPIHDETFATVAQAAVHGGVTTIANQLYPNADESTPDAIARMIRESEGGTADFAAHVRWDRARSTSDIAAAAAAGAVSIKVFLAHPDKSIQSSLGELATALSQAKAAGLLTLVHAELGDVVDELFAAGFGSQGSASEINQWRSPAIEAAAVNAAAVVSRAVESPLYIVHTSCEASMRAGTAARENGTELYVETCPHYLFLDVDQAPPGGQGFVLPPLRPRQDRDFMRSAAVAGSVDTLGSDHCGHGPRSKPVDSIAGAKAGLPGLEAMVPLIIDAAIGPDAWLPRHRAVEMLSSSAARIFGLDGKGSIGVGYDADIIAIDPMATQSLSSGLFHDAAGYTPYEGRSLSGQIEQVFRRGELVVSEGNAQSIGGGRFIRGSRRSSRSGVN
ncbi:dihydroorotase family protein [Salinibacterium sp. SWN167]|uniref:dihydroorotase n=1 Tax=Salinibacterium sp. SWN167 TaxID=2792054 RepID=UPI0018CF87BD|nr:dihydroorotase family protein [Salinibacterium sp. SWN167]MBH0083695.1 dihydroorotase family protein [Salinibacterium sp. SWN167]